MLVIAAKYLILALGIAVCLFAAWGLFDPRKLITAASDIFDRGWGIAVASVGRLLLGAALIIAAPESLFPNVFTILGWLAIIAAVGIVIMGQVRMRKMVNWFAEMPPLALRIWLLFAIAFGAFLIYGVM